jgi:hypothetical protein
MTKLRRLIIKAALAWLEARKAYGSRYAKHRLGS